MHAGLRDSFHCRAVYVTHCTPVRLQCSQGRYGDTDVYAGMHMAPCGWILYSDFEINQGARGCSREAAQQQLDRCEQAPVAQASWAGLPRVF